MTASFTPAKPVNQTDAPPYHIAELSANHNGSLERAIRIVHAAHAAGADAVKLQTYTATSMTIESQALDFQISGGTAWDGRSLHELYSEASTPLDWHEPLRIEIKRLGLDFISSAFDATGVSFLDDLQVDAIKIASFELVDTPLISAAAATGRPLILSTGMASLAEIEEAVSTARGSGAKQIVLLKCTSAYPAPTQEMNLATIPHLSNAFGVSVGLSDHTLGSFAAVTAVALGARLIEKHLTLSRADGGPDSAFSAEPAEFAEMVSSCRQAALAVGTVHYGPTPSESSSVNHRRSLFVVSRVCKGEKLTVNNVKSIRPNSGLPPRFLPVVLGRRASVDIAPGTPLTWSHFTLE